MTWVILLISLSAQLGEGCSYKGNGLGQGEGDCQGFFNLGTGFGNPVFLVTFPKIPISGGPWRHLLNLNSLLLHSLKFFF